MRVLLSAYACTPGFGSEQGVGWHRTLQLARFHEVWVVRAPSGVPSLCVTGQARVLADAAGVTRWHLSLTHSDLMAIAYVVAE